MATYYYDLSLGVNGTGTTASPYNVWPGTAVSAGDSHLFKRGTTGGANFAISSGANGSITRYGAWANADGTDNTALARPIISTGAVMSTFGTRKGHLRLENLDIRAPAITVANDVSLVFLSNSATVVGCNIDTNVGGIGIWHASNVTVQSCTVQAVTHSNANNNQVLMVEGTAMDAITITNNVFLHGGGGGTTSHNSNFEGTDSTNPITNLVVTNNTWSTSVSASCSNRYAIASRFVCCPSVSVTGNTARFHLVGASFVGGGKVCTAYVSSNTYTNNYHFGIQMTTDMVGAIIQYNTCSSNGTTTVDGGALYAYGRGIELSGAAGQSRCASHTVRFNTCNNNLNYGGPLDNGSEGVGIGLDDGTVNCTVYGNTCTNNEGNGIQLYGGGNSATWTDTHNTIFANFFDTNCTASIKNRQTGGTYRTLFCADINLAYTYGGGGTIIANNLHIGGTSCGVAMGNSNGQSITIANNIMLNMANNCMDGRSTRSGSHYIKNWLFQTTNFRFCLDSVDANGEPTYPIIPSFQATTDTYTSNPMVSAGSTTAWMPAFGSPCIHVAYSLSGVTTDFQNRSFKSPGTVGIYEYVGPEPPPSGRWFRRVVGKT